MNETYIGVLKDIVAGLADKGIYTYLDMHQVTWGLSQAFYQWFDYYQGLRIWMFYFLHFLLTITSSLG